jgi:hypothetical protein
MPMRIKAEDHGQAYAKMRARGLTHGEAEDAIEDMEAVVAAYNAGELDPEVMKILSELKPKAH